MVVLLLWCSMLACLPWIRVQNKTMRIEFFSFKNIFFQKLFIVFVLLKTFVYLHVRQTKEKFLACDHNSYPGRIRTLDYHILCARTCTQYRLALCTRRPVDLVVIPGADPIKKYLSFLISCSNVLSIQTA